VNISSLREKGLLNLNLLPYCSVLLPHPPLTTTTPSQHGTDGLSNISQTHPHFTPPPLPTSGATHDYLDIEEKKPGYEVMLDILRSEEEGTVRIIALGPRKSEFDRVLFHPSALYTSLYNSLMTLKDNNSMLISSLPNVRSEQRRPSLPGRPRDV
jgi:hypothetical protein